MIRVLKYNLQRPCGPVRPPSLRCVTAYAIDQDACEQLQCESVPKPVLCSKPYKPVRGIGCCGSDRFTSWILSVEDLRPFPFQAECSEANGTFLLQEIDPTKLLHGPLMADPTKRTWAYAFIGDENGRVPPLYPYSPSEDDYDAYAPTPWIWILQCIGPYFNQNDIVLLDGGDVFWDVSASKAHFRAESGTPDFKIGTAVGQRLSEPFNWTLFPSMGVEAG